MKSAAACNANILYLNSIPVAVISRHKPLKL
jgi:hypothetical protein